MSTLIEADRSVGNDLAADPGWIYAGADRFNDAAGIAAGNAWVLERETGDTAAYPEVHLVEGGAKRADDHVPRRGRRGLGPIGDELDAGRNGRPLPGANDGSPVTRRKITKDRPVATT